MRTLFILCTAVTVLQVFDVSITAIPAEPPPKVNALKRNVDPNNSAVPGKLTTRALKKTNTADPDPVDNTPGTNPNDDDSEEAELPKTIVGSTKRVGKTAQKVAVKGTVAVLNGITRILKSTGKVTFFGKFLLDRSNNVKDMAKEGFNLLSDLSDTTPKGVKHVFNSSRVIGKQIGKTSFTTLQKATSLGKNLTKLTGTVVDTPISIGDDVTVTTNRIAKVPSVLSKMVTDGAINPVLGSLVPESDEEPEEEKQELPKPEVPAPTPRKAIAKKPTK